MQLGAAGAAMTGVDEQAAALRRLVERLDDTATVLAGLRDAVAGAWDDTAGREWTGRLDLVRRAADRLAGEATTAASDLEQRAPGSGADAGADAAAGVRLPGLAGIRTSDRRGPVAPLLPPMHDGTAER